MNAAHRLFARIKTWHRLRQLTDGSVSDRISAAKALGDMREPRAVNLLIQCLRYDRAPFYELREAAAAALGAIGDQRAVDPLLDHLLVDYWDDWDHLFSPAFDALVKIGGPQVIQGLVPILGHREGAVRRRAADTLAKLGETQWENRIVGDMQDYTRLGQSADSQAVKALLQGFRFYRWDENRNTAYAAISEGLANLLHCVPKSVESVLFDSGGRHKRAGKSVRFCATERSTD